jgi:hypothetical protein
MQTRYPTNAESSWKQPKSRINLLSGIVDAVSHKVTPLEVRITYDRQNLLGLWQSFRARLHVGTVEQLYCKATPIGYNWGKNSLRDSDKDFRKILSFCISSFQLLRSSKDLAPSLFQDWKPITGEPSRKSTIILHNIRCFEKFAALERDGFVAACRYR